MGDERTFGQTLYVYLSVKGELAERRNSYVLLVIHGIGRTFVVELG
jgi:hypothetical protein